jgi:hypothetical protein
MKIKSSVVAITLILAALTGFAKEQSSCSSPFANPGFEPAAAGSVKGAFKATGAKLDVKLTGLTPTNAYQLVVGGVAQADFVAGTSGKAKLKFQNKAGKPATLDFDPRGKSFAIVAGTNVVLATVYSGPGESEGSAAYEETALTPTALAPGGSGRAVFREKAGQQEFEVELEDAPPGVYDLLVDGLPRTSLTVAADGTAGVKFASSADPGEIPLDFDPRGKGVDVVQGTNIFFTSTLIAQIPGLTSCTPTGSVVTLASTGLNTNASAHATSRVDADCDRTFEVEAEDLPAGDYDLFVAGVARGVLVIESIGGGQTEGKLEFSSDPDEQGKSLLDFDVTDQLLEIRQGTNVFFSSTLTGGTNAPPPACVTEETEVTLFNTDFDPDGKGKARWRQQDDCRQIFRVEIQDVALGAYKIHVDGDEKGSITVVNINGENVGEIEFDTDPQGNDYELLFDPRGKLIEIEKNGDIYLSRVFPASN